MKCPICNGKVVETDKYGTEEECEKCGTIFKLRPMEKENESTK